MSEPRGDTAVLRFFANALVAIGWLMLTLGGLCTLIFGAMAVGDDREFRISAGDWMLPGAMLAIGGGALLVGRAIKRGVKRTAGTDSHD